MLGAIGLGIFFERSRTRSQSVDEPLESAKNLFLTDKKFGCASQGQIRAPDKRVAERFGAIAQSGPHRRHKRYPDRGGGSRSDIDAPGKPLAKDGFEAGDGQRVPHRRGGGKERMCVRRQAWIVVGEEIGQYDAKKSVSGEALADFIEEPHWVGDEIDRVRDVDHMISDAQVHILDLADPHPNAHFLVHLCNRGIGVDSFGVPTVVSECLHRLAETAGDVEKVSSAGSGKRRKNAVGACGELADADAAACPGVLEFGGAEAGRALVFQPDSLQDAQIRLVRRVGGRAAAAQPPFVSSIVARFAPPALDFRIDVKRNGPVFGAVANWAIHSIISTGPVTDGAACAAGAV